MPSSAHCLASKHGATLYPFLLEGVELQMLP